MLELKEGLNRDVDLIEDGCLLPFAVESAERDEIHIYERKLEIKDLKIQESPSNLYRRMGIISLIKLRQCKKQ